MRIAIAGATGLVGRELTAAARKAGHEVAELSRANGVDLVDGTDAELDRALAGAEAVVDVTNSPTIEQDGATAFFEHRRRAAGRGGHPGRGRPHRAAVDHRGGPHAGGRLLRGQAGPRAGRRGPRAGAAGAARGPVPRVRRAVPRLGPQRGRGDVPDMPMQPVALAEVVRVLLELATAAEPGRRGGNWPGRAGNSWPSWWPAWSPPAESRSGRAGRGQRGRARRGAAARPGRRARRTRLHRLAGRANA